jgi:hypothetical protein
MNELRRIVSLALRERQSGGLGPLGGTSAAQDPVRVRSSLVSPASAHMPLPRRAGAGRVTPRAARVLAPPQRRAVYCSHMKRTQIYIREDQAQRILEQAEERGVSQAELIRQILDAALDTGDAEAEARAAILATAGVLPDAPDWPEWQRSVRGRTAADRLDELDS